MKIMSYRIIPVFLSVIILLTVILLTNFSAAGEPRYESPGMTFMDETKAGKDLYEKYKVELPSLPGGGFPPQYITGPEGTKLYVNLKLWLDHSILCYGEWSDVPDNYKTSGTVGFKSSTQKPGYPVEKNKGYYLKNGKRGEYRYHGYDINGNKLTNLYFEVDSSVTKFDERVWIKNPWTELPSSYKYKPNYESVYNKVATDGKRYPNPAVQPGVQNWINKAMQLYGGVPLIGAVVDPEVFRYLYVESAPTTLGLGQGRMWHERDNGSIWYQTIAVPQLTEKKNLPVEAEIVLLTELPENITDVGTAMDDMEITLEFEVSAILKDDDIFDDPVQQTVFYTRYDIKDWNITFSAPEQTEQADPKAINTVNRGSRKFKYTTTYGYLKAHSKSIGGKTTWNLHFTATARPNYKNGSYGLIDNAAYDLGIGVVQAPEPPAQVVVGFTPAPDIPEIAFDGVPFTASDVSDMSIVEYRKVFVDGIEVDGNQFFSGNYIFPGAVGVNGRFAYVDCEYKVEGFPSETGKAVTRDVVYIYPTKPIANYKISSDTWKQNRLIKVQEASDEGNIRLVIDKYPIVEYQWTFGGNTSQLRKGANSDISKELLYKEPGIYSLTLKVKNTLGKWSDPYNVTFEVLEDIAPAVGVNLSESVYTRNDKVSAWYYLAASTDGDIIKSSEIELWHDSDNDRTVDKRLKTWSNQDEFPAFNPPKLGYYKYIISAKEDIIDDTLFQYITEEDKKSATYEVEFWVDNYQPISDLYVNIPIQRPSIDVYFMLDKNLSTEKADYIKSSRVNMSNWLLGKNIIPNVNIWDMKTYTYSQPANTSVNTGESYPSTTYVYSSSGYSGTLERTSVSNNSYSRDQGKYETRQESKSVSQAASNTNSVTYRWSGSSWVQVGKDESQLPSSRSYTDSSGYSGTLQKSSGIKTGTSGSAPSNPNIGQTYTYYSYWSCTYSGTVYRTVNVWVPNIVWYDNYTGYYSGTINKNVRQPYTDPFKATSAKYVVYISDGAISEPSDLSTVMGYASTAKLYLAGADEIKTQREHDKYFSMTDETIDVVLDEILNYFSSNSPDVERFYLLQNENFVMNAGQLDLENDPIVETGMQYVHEANYYDNPTGNEPGTVVEFNENIGWSATVKSSLSNVGKYTVYRRVKDKPTTDPNFAQYSYYSGNTSLEIYVVRKPIALATLDWDYDTSSSIYKTTWIDQSYDPDHQYSRADKGIVERNIMWKRSGGQWNYGIPDNLTPGNYELNYYVLDPEGYWSDPFTMNFTLSEAPSIQFTAALRTLSSDFSLTGIPASEKLEAYNLWTRHPQNVRLEMALYNGTSRVSPLKTVTFEKSTGTRVNNDITWNNVIYQIPETLPDRAYDFRISAVGDDGQRTEKSFIVNVATPLKLEPVIPAEVNGGVTTEVSAHTTEYAEDVTVILFYGTPYARTPYTLTEFENAAGGGKLWEGSPNVLTGIPEGDYVARFTATAPNGTTQSRNLPFTLVNLGISNVSISGYWNHWRGQVDIFGKRLTNEPHRFLSLERVKINVSTIGEPERVTIRFSPELEAMQYTDPKGHSYDYAEDFFDYDVAFPEDSTFSGSANSIAWEYYLPLAPSTKDWDDTRLRSHYRMTVTAYKGNATATYEINDIDITGNIYDLTYIQPKD